MVVDSAVVGLTGAFIDWDGRDIGASPFTGRSVATDMTPSPFRDNWSVSHYILADGGIMDRFEALRTFVAVADNRSFAEAARRLRISPTAASRAIGDLE